LNCVALRYSALDRSAVHCITSHSLALYYIALHCITLYYIALYYITLHCIALHYISLHCIPLHQVPLGRPPICNDSYVLVVQRPDPDVTRVITPTGASRTATRTATAATRARGTALRSPTRFTYSLFQYICFLLF
jgi:hypothetical protein